MGHVDYKLDLSFPLGFLFLIKGMALFYVFVV